MVHKWIYNVQVATRLESTPIVVDGLMFISQPIDVYAIDVQAVRLIWEYHHDFFFSSRRRHTRFDCDWSSDVCSSDLNSHRAQPNKGRQTPEPKEGLAPAGRWILFPDTPFQSNCSRHLRAGLWPILPWPQLDRKSVV